jgi:hypothetical protein
VGSRAARGEDQDEPTGAAVAIQERVDPFEAGVEGCKRLGDGRFVNVAECLGIADPVAA